MALAWCMQTRCKTSSEKQCVCACGKYRKCFHSLPAGTTTTSKWKAAGVQGQQDKNWSQFKYVEQMSNIWVHAWFEFLYFFLQINFISWHVLIKGSALVGMPLRWDDYCSRNHRCIRFERADPDIYSMLDDWLLDVMKLDLNSWSVRVKSELILLHVLFLWEKKSNYC